MHAHALIFAKHRQIFAKIELIAQFVDRRMPLADLLYRCRRKQPLRQRIFSHACARRGKKLK